MILADSSAWMSLFKGEAAVKRMPAAIEENEIVTHPFVHGELVLGGMNAEQVDLFNALRQLPMLDHQDMAEFAVFSKLAGRKIGWIDAHLLGAALANDTGLFTFDQSLKKLALEHGCYTEP